MCCDRIDVVAVHQQFRSPAARHDELPSVGRCSWPTGTSTTIDSDIPCWRSTGFAVCSMNLYEKCKKLNNEKYVYLRALLVILGFLSRSIVIIMCVSRKEFTDRILDSDQTSSNHGWATVWTRRRDNTVSLTLELLIRQVCVMYLVWPLRRSYTTIELEYFYHYIRIFLFFLWLNSFHW